MAIAADRDARPASGRDRRDRRTRWLTAVVLAVSLVAGAVAPAVAADPTPTPGPVPSPIAGEADPTASPSMEALPTPTPSPTASTEPALGAWPSPAPFEPGTDAGAAGDEDPMPSPSPTPSASPIPTATPTPTATATPTPTPTATPWPTPDWPTTVTTLGENVRFWGQGYGHGVGMSQHGARGRAEAGQDAETILKAYFKGATMGTVKATRLVRVLVLDGFRATADAPLVVIGRGGAWTVDGAGASFPSGAMLEAWRTGGGTWRIRVRDGGGELYSGSFTGRPYISPTTSSSYLQLFSKGSTYDTYRGSLRIVPDGTRVRVANHVALDTYLRGVVPFEMPVSWSEEALRAQVIAARSYAIQSLNPDRGVFDVYDDTRSQLYRGREGERAASDRLIADEPGVVIRYHDDKVIKAFFFSTGGGSTENNEYVFVSSNGTPGTTKVAYLRGITDRSPATGQPYDVDAPHYKWSTTSLSRETLSSMFAKDSRTDVGNLTRLDLRRRGVSGRLYQVVLRGSKGSKTVSADTFRSIYNARKPTSADLLRSNLFDTRPIAGS